MSPIREVLSSSWECSSWRMRRFLCWIVSYFETTRFREGINFIL